MDDYISRQAAINGIAEYYKNKQYIARHRKILSAICLDLKSVIDTLPAVEAEPEIIRCKDCKNSEHWYRDRRRCFLWSEEGVSVFDDGFCNYAERKQDE